MPPTTDDSSDSEQKAESKTSRGHSTPESSTAEQPLRVGVLLPGETVPAWMKRAIERMVAETNVEITHLVINDDAGPDDLSDYRAGSFPGGVLEYISCSVERLRKHLLWSLTGVARQFAETPDYQEPKAIDSIAGFSGAKRLYCQPLPASGFGNLLPDDVAEEVGENTDAVIRFGFGVLKGEFLEMPTHGVLSFHRGDLETYRGQPGGLWEFLNDEPTAGITLQRISETLDGGEIIAERTVDISDARTWREIERRQIAVCEQQLAVGVRRLRDSTFEPTTPDSLGTLYTMPTGVDVVRYVCKTAIGTLCRDRQTGTRESSQTQRERDVT
ncbi:formyltransferase family protein [Haladaptatus cibarius]|uniref:formyltransferase family protein n=1 Tax=Haladaptatus cibarius TaxID=453847 RepID=UPI00067896AD|nr:formyltransferase family protein [Haladaptatus cibarius]